MHLRELTSVLRNDLEGWVKGGSKGKVKCVRDICIHIADPFCCRAETNRAV